MDSDSQTAGTEKIPGCFLRYLHQAMDGKPVCLSTDNITCGGGKFYAGFRTFVGLTDPSAR